MAKYSFRTATAAAALAIGFLPAAAFASATFVGSWEVDQGPWWSSAPPNGPLAYTGQEAAALLFGGSPGDYAISTVSSDPNQINNMAWYSVIGYYGNQNNGGSLLSQNYNSKYLGQYYGPTSGYPAGDPNAAASAYVGDNAEGATFTNYAFRISNVGGAVPEPATWAMMLIGFGAIDFAMRRRYNQRPNTLLQLA